MARRTFLAQLSTLPFLAWGTTADESKKSLKIMMKSAWGPETQLERHFLLPTGSYWQKLAIKYKFFFSPKPHR